MHEQTAVFFGHRGDDLARLLRKPAQGAHVRTRQHNTAAVIAAFDLAYAAVEDDVAAFEDRNVVAEFLDIVHLVAGKQHDFIVLDQLVHNVLEQHGVDGVQPRKRFIQNHDLRIV